jgi:hypothetical protein
MRDRRRKQGRASVRMSRNTVFDEHLRKRAVSWMVQRASSWVFTHRAIGPGYRYLEGAAVSRASFCLPGYSPRVYSRRHDLSIPLPERLKTNLSMPRAARRPFKVLDSQFLGLCFRWMVFKQLYVSGEKRIRLFNTTAPGFFGHLQPIWIDSVILGVTRLLDPPETGRGKKAQPNMTLRQIVGHLGNEDSRFLNRLIRQLDRLERRCEPFRTHRNKRVAHAGLRPGTQARLFRLPSLSKRRIDGMLNAIEKFMNTVRNRYDMGNMLYTDVQGAPGADGDALLWSLAKAAAWDDQYPNVLENAQKLSKTRYHDAWGG